MEDRAMKKTAIISLMAGAAVLAACTKEITPSQELKKGMTLSVEVVDPSTKAGFTDNSDGSWAFNFQEGDKVTVWNSEAGEGTRFEFVFDGTNFVGEHAVPTAATATWYAEFGTGSVAEQDGTKANLANCYALRGSQTDVAAESTTLSIYMLPQLSVLKVKNWNDAFGLKVKFSDGKFWDGTYSYDASGAIVYGESDDATVYTASKEAYSYAVVPAATQITIMDGETVVNSTKASGLTAGKYYTLKVGNGWCLKGSWDDWADDIVLTEVIDGRWVSSPLEMAANTSFKFHLNDTWQGTNWELNGDWGKMGKQDKLSFGSNNIVVYEKSTYPVILDFISKTIYFGYYCVCGSTDWTVDYPLFYDGSKYFRDFTVPAGYEFKVKEFNTWSWSVGADNATGDNVSSSDGNIKITAAGKYRIEFTPGDTATIVVTLL